MTQATNDYAQAQAASANKAGALTGTTYHDRPALLCVPRDRTARPRWPSLIPLAGGGFEWHREAVLLSRAGEFKAAAAAAADYRAGRDFILCDISDPWDGKPANVHGLGFPVRLRFAGLRRATVVEG